MRKFSCLIMLLLVIACKLGGAEIRPLNPPFLPGPPQGGPQEFQQGWRDGCDTGLAQHGTDIYRSSYTFRQDPSQVLNPVYYKAWKDAENFCRTYIYEYSVRSMDIYCSVDGLVNDCLDTEKTAAPFMGGTGDAIGGGFFGGGGGTGSGIGALMGGSGGGAPGFGDASEGSIFGNW